MPAPSNLPMWRCQSCNKLLLFAKLPRESDVYIRRHRCKFENFWGAGRPITGMTMEPRPPRRPKCDCDKERRQSRPLFDVDKALSAIDERWERLQTGLKEIEQAEREFEERRERHRHSTEVRPGLRFNVFMRDGFRCQYCGRSAQDGAVLNADHIHPESQGGQTTMDNLITACWECNNGKRAKVLAFAPNVPIDSTA